MKLRVELRERARISYTDHGQGNIPVRNTERLTQFIAVKTTHLMRRQPHRGGLQAKAYSRRSGIVLRPTIRRIVTSG